jgi:SAM-dependent methyltransferase
MADHSPTSSSRPALTLDDPALTDRRADVIMRKRFLRKIHDDWYRRLVSELPSRDGVVLEIGTGAGFLCDYVPGLVTSDIMPVRTVEVVFDACKEIPMAPSSLRAIVMVNVLHHLPNVSAFFDVATTALRPGGRIVMIEPWNTPWSSLIYKNAHHEPFEPNAKEWIFETSGPLSGANGALPWIVFARDYRTFEHRHPKLCLKTLEPLMPFSYLLSGGFTAPSLAPAWAYGMIRRLERITGLDARAGMFATITIEKRHDV